MLIVADDHARSERELANGELACPECEAELRPWGHARPRWLRIRGGRRLIVPRRACCRGCRRTHVLLPGVMLLRCADAVEVIGEALVAAADGQGQRAIAARLGRPHATVRGWLRRFSARAEATATHAVACVYRFDHRAFRVEPIDALPRLRAVLELLAATAASAERYFKTAARSRWQVISALCAGRLLANTSCPYPPLR